ncbi:OmpH family outer membrane protein [Inmirania thermothiophila]|uniref:Periplasmic chaperone for outer membrane proteins Skp n=1 Tax=Inmirania thermothiophila TaxID=1750597 RepID=A0A3N1Y048_9GAMM|nr:OmpH family outer membrane protein [Inmirania thermothiophila]ROR32223.1 periplasmic chaperone for outer membrane proteins Skp [Inmirania thermothiophila]
MSRRFLGVAAWVLAALLAAGGAGAAELRIGYVNPAKVLEAAPQRAAAEARLEEEFSPRQRELVAKQKELRGLEERLARDGAIMSEAERGRLEQEIRSRQRELKREGDEFREDLNIRRNEELAKLQRLVAETIRRLAAEGGYDLVLTDGVLYASERVDLTARVIEALKARQRPDAGR